MSIGHTAERHTPSTVQSMSAPEVRRTPSPTDRLHNHNRDPITHMIRAILNNNKDMNPDDLIVIKTKLNISSPEEYSG